jgi:iron complex transport system substrate-binding protein
MNRRLIIILFIAVLMLTACQRSAAGGEVPITDGVEITDMTGKTITLKKLPERIVSLSPSNTEIVFALGAGDKLVGITSFCDYPEETQNVEKIGDFEGPNIELIKKAEPDVILAGVYIQDDIAIAIENLGIPVITTEAVKFDGIYESIELIGRIVGEENKAESIMHDMLNTIESIKGETNAGQKPKVFYVAWTDPLITTGSDTFVNDVILISGALNIAEEIIGWTHYSTEELLKQNPDILIVAWHATDDGISKEEIMADPILKNLDCVKKGHIYIMKDDNLISRPGPRIVQGVREMSDAINNILK